LKALLVTELVLREALTQLAAEAGERFDALVEGGAEIPFEIDQQPGEASPLYRYVPQTQRFVQLHAAELKKLPSFGPAIAAIASSGAAESYLEQRGLPVPADGKRRAEQLVVVFCEELWAGREDFSLDGVDLEGTIKEVEFGSAGGIETDGLHVLCPLVGFQMPVTKLELATATVVRAEVTELPREALRSEGMGRAAWEPQFVAVARCLDGQQPAETIGAQLEELVTAMRLLRPGGVALGPYAWTRSGKSDWRRMATGAARPRGGGYTLGEADCQELVDLSRDLASRPHREGSVGWAIARFEMGCERQTIFEGLSDYLLSLRGILEGGGPAGAALPMRIAALCAEPERREALRSAIERALVLESRLMGGGPTVHAGDETALRLAAEIEDHARAILRDAACGDLGDDLRATADEILIADGLAAGDSAGDMGATSEWEPPLPPGPGIRVFAAKNGEIPSPGPDTTDAHNTPDWETDEVESGGGEETQPMEITDVVTPIDRARKAEVEEKDERLREPRIDRTSRQSVRDFFPAPETTDWTIRELKFSR
jgi:hypothetical protein